MIVYISLRMHAVEMLMGGLLPSPVLWLDIIVLTGLLSMLSAVLVWALNTKH